MTAPAVITEAGFDELVATVQAALVKRYFKLGDDGDGYFEICVEAINAADEGFAVWLCGRCGADTDRRACAEHDNDDLPGYFETWLRTSGGTVAGRCHCGKSTTRHTCSKHVRRARAERELSGRLDRDES